MREMVNRVQYYAGAGKAELRIPAELFPTGEGFTAIHDPLYVRAFFLKEKQSILFLCLDLTSLPTEEIEGLQELAKKTLPFDVNQVWVSVSHTFSAPHLCPEAFVRTGAERRANAVLRDAIAEAVRTAVSAAAVLSPVTLRVNTGVCDVNINRDQETENGWWLGANEDGCSDKRLTVLQARRTDGPIIGCLVHYAVQSSVMDGSVTTAGDKLVSGDLAGRAMEQLERAIDATALFLVGAAGDQAPRKQAVTAAEDAHEAGFRYVEELGDQLCEAALECIHGGGTVVEEGLCFREQELTCKGQVLPDRMMLRPTHDYMYESAAPVTTRICMMTAGKLAIAGIQPELGCEIAMQIQARADLSTVLVATMVNGGAKYMADQISYERFTYEARNSGFAKGSAEKLMECVLQMLRENNCGTAD